MATQDRDREQELGRPLGHLASGEEHVGSMCSRDRTCVQRLPQALTLPSSRALEWVLLVPTESEQQQRGEGKVEGERYHFLPRGRFSLFQLREEQSGKVYYDRDIAN